MHVLEFHKLSDEDKMNIEEDTIDSIYTYIYVVDEIAIKLPEELHNRINAR